MTVKTRSVLTSRWPRGWRHGRPLFADMAVALQLRVLLAALELVRTTARRDPARPAGPPSPSAPHHAAFQKRKSIAGES